MLLSLLATVSLADFEATMNKQDSATTALRQWCEVRGIARPANIRAAQVAASSAVPPSDLHRRLGLSRNQGFAFRHVRLSCGETVMSEAYNWYVPSRLTPAMNARLASTDSPFGTVAASLQFRRQRLRPSPLATRMCPAGTILTHRARLVLPDGRPLALLIECYTAANLMAGN